MNSSNLPLPPSLPRADDAFPDPGFPYPESGPGYGSDFAPGVGGPPYAPAASPRPSRLPGLVRGIRRAGWVALALAFLFLVTGVFDALFVKWLARMFEDGFRQLWWLNPHVGKIVGSLLLAVGGPLYFRWDAWCPKLLGRRIGALLMWGGIVSLVTHSFALLGGGAANFDERGQVLRFYSIDPDNGVRYSYYDRVNPLTGERFLPVTPALALELQRRERLKFAEVPAAEALASPWFAPGTGVPLLWQSRRGDGSLHFFNLPGFDPATAQPLGPVDPALREKFQQQEQSARAEAARLQADQQARDQAAAETARVAAQRLAETEAVAALARQEENRLAAQTQEHVRRKAEAIRETEALKVAEIRRAEEAKRQAEEAKLRAEQAKKDEQSRKLAEARRLGEEARQQADNQRRAQVEAAAREAARHSNHALRRGLALHIHNVAASSQICSDGPFQGNNPHTGQHFIWEGGPPVQFEPGHLRDWQFIPLGPSATHIHLELLADP